MRHKYTTTALVLKRYPIGEASARVVLLTGEFGLVSARAQGLRKPEAKMASALQTYTNADVTLIKGKDGWRVTNAVLVCNYAQKLEYQTRLRAARITDLVERLFREQEDVEYLHSLVTSFIEALPALTEEQQDAAECLAAVRILASQGFDAGDIPGEHNIFDTASLQEVHQRRALFIQRINTGIGISGL